MNSRQRRKRAAALHNERRTLVCRYSELRISQIPSNLQSSIEMLDNIDSTASWLSNDSLKNEIGKLERLLNN